MKIITNDAVYVQYCDIFNLVDIVTLMGVNCPSSVSTRWSSTSTKPTAEYYKNLRADNSATVTLTANWSGNVPLPTTTKTGYTCKYNTESDGSGTSYSSGGTYTVSKRIFISPQKETD